MKTKGCHLFEFTASVLFFTSFLWTTSAQTVSGWQASKATVERLSKSRSEFNYYEEKVPAYTLPALLTAGNGKVISTKHNWIKIRRPELIELYRTNIYGRVQ